MKITESILQLQPTGKCAGTIRIPASKSHAQRALACALLSDKKTVLRGIGTSNDEQVLIGILKQSQAKYTTNGETITIDSGEKLRFNDSHIHFGESGLAARMCTPILAICDQELTISGSGSLTERPMHVFREILPQLGVDYADNDGKLPIRLKGPILPADVTMNGSLSSQFITGILYGIAGSKPEKATSITLENPVSIPYLNLSIAVLREFGIDVERNHNRIAISGPVNWQNTDLTIEADWSSASFLLVLAALSGEITITNLNRESLQADSKITDALEAFGAIVEWNDSALTVRRNEHKHIDFDATHCPDLFPPLAALACFGNSPSRITGVHRLHNKESNRALTLQSELGKLGAKIHFENDDMIVNPVRSVKQTIVDSFNDHRIAMACAIVILNGTHASKISRPEAVNKSFPDFFRYIELLTTLPQPGSH